MSRKKGIFSKSELKTLLAKKNSCVSVKKSVIDVYLLPYYLNDVVTGLWNALHQKLKTYDTRLEGIILGYENIKVDLDAGRFSGRNAEIKYPVSCDCYIFQPSVGEMLQGKVNQMSSDHIGCIVLQYFNATIMRPSDEPAEYWNNRCIDYDEVITFKVKELDYTGFIPYIEGELEMYYPKAIKEKLKFHQQLFTKLNQYLFFRNDASLISSTQLPTKRSISFSDSGLEFDLLSPIPQLKEDFGSVKKPKTYRKDFDEEEEVKFMPNQKTDASSKYLKRKYEISPDKKSAKKMKLNSENEVGSSTGGSGKENRKKKKSLFDFLEPDANSSSKGMNDSKIKKSSNILEDELVLKNTHETGISLSPYSDAIESVIKKTTSASYSDTIDSVIKQISTEEKENSSSIKKNKKKIDKKEPSVLSEELNSTQRVSHIAEAIESVIEFEQIKSDSEEQTILNKKKKKHSVQVLPTISEVIESSVKASHIVPKIKISKDHLFSKNIKKQKTVKIVEESKQKKTKATDPLIKEKSTVNNLADNNSKGDKIEKLGLTNGGEKSSLSPYSDAIESVIKQTNSVSYLDAIDSVIKQNTCATPEDSPRQSKKKKKNLEHTHIISHQQNDPSLGLHISQVIETVIKQSNPGSETTSSSTQKKKKTPVKQVVEQLKDSVGESSKKSKLKLVITEENELKPGKNKKRASLNLGEKSQMSALGDTPKISKKGKKFKVDEDPDAKMLVEYLNKMKEIAAKGGKQDLLLSMINNFK